MMRQLACFVLSLFIGLKQNMQQNNFCRQNVCNRWVMDSSPIRDVLFSKCNFDYNFDCYNNNWSQSKMGVCCPGMVGVLCVNLYEQNDLYCQSHYSKSWIGKCHNPVAEWLVQSVCNGGVVGSSLIRGVLFSTSWNFGCFKSNCSQSKSVMLPTHGCHYVC